MSRGRSIGALAGLLACLVIAGLSRADQVAAVWLYLRVERSRRPAATFTTTALPGTPAPSLIAERPDGAILGVADRRGRVRVIHFCPTRT